MPEMPEWKRKALELWPDVWDYLDEEDSIYMLYFELLPRCNEAHRARDDQQLTKIYDYAEWCFNQPEKDVWNAAGVCFYEHLVDEPDTRDAIPTWVKPEVYAQVWVLFQNQLGADEFTKMDKIYREQHPEMAE